MSSAEADSSPPAVPGAALAEVTRGPLIESQHLGHIAVAAANGQLIGAVGQAQACIFLRSAAKPIQALVPVQARVVEAFGLQARHVAVMCGSHQGLERHTSAVQEILERAGLGPDALRCGVAVPASASAAHVLAAAGEEPSALHNNCSGKHAGMLAACRRLGLDTADYLSPSHPLQQRILTAVAILTGVATEDIAIGVDGCGLPTFGLPLVNAATAYARLAAAKPGHEPELPSELAAAETVKAAMAAHPDMVSGPGSFNTKLLAAWGPQMVAKGGAEAVFCLGLADQGIGMAIKITDGNPRAIPPVVLAVLEQLDALPAEAAEALKGLSAPPVTNSRGQVVGQIRPTLGRFL